MDKSNGEYLGEKISVYAKKNKTWKPKIEKYVTIIPPFGISRELDILDLAIETGICKKKGSWVYYKDDIAVGNGTAKCVEKLMDSPELLNNIWEDCKKAIDPKVDMKTGEILEELTSTELVTTEQT